MGMLITIILLKYVNLMSFNSTVVYFLLYAVIIIFKEITMKEFKYKTCTLKPLILLN